MLTESSATQQGEPLIAAKNRIQTGPVPGWVAACPFRADFKAGPDGHVTYLLFDRQIHAGLHQTHVHAALRLETMQAVRNESPWRLDFEPGQEQITLHWIKTRRGGAQFVHDNLSSARVVEAQDRPVLLLMLEDVRPGDILEWCYTVENRPLLLPDHCACLFTLPAGAPVGKFHFSVRFNPSRPMQWKSSAPEWQPVKTPDNGEVCWAWTRENYPGLRPEENTPDWLMAHPWIQISDWPDWGTVAAAFAEAWPEDEADATAGKIAGEIAAAKGGSLQQAEKAVRLVQDEYRHLAVHGELDGQPPAPPGVVARRRYGDGKDLSFLLWHLLKRLGVPARLVLVNTNLRQSVAGLLAAPGLFNHLLVEYQAGGATHWADAAGKRPLDYGLGLPVDGRSSRLVEPPASSAPDSVCELTESILLDTSGAWSLLAVVVAARGSPAGVLRRELEREGLEGLAKKRLRDCADRFSNARRAGPLEYRDDPEANEFFLAEIFEIKGFLVPDPKSKQYKLDLANDHIANFLKAPGAGPRRTLFALPHPCNIMHTVELHSVALPPAVVQQRSVETGYLQFNRLRKTLAGNWTMTLSLSTLASAVPPEDLDEHRETLQEIREQSAWSLLVPAGDSRPRQRGDFGALPVAWQPAVSIPGRSRLRPQPPPDPAVGNEDPKIAVARENGAAPPDVPASAESDTKFKRRKRNRRKRDTEPVTRWHIMAACGLGLILIVLVVLAAKNADRWQIFKRRPPPPATPVNAEPVQ
jgi:hypothetical protein